MATALAAGNFDLKRVALDPQNNVVICWGTITGNDDYATETWLITPALLGLSTIHYISVSCLVKDDNQATPVECVVGLQDMGDGTYSLEVFKDWAGAAATVVDSFENETFQILCIGSGAVAAAS